MKLKKRWKRLILPHVFWGIFYYVSYIWIDAVTYVDLGIRSKDLFWQLLTGHPQHLNGALWYQVNLIWITLMFSFIVHIWRSHDGRMIFSLIAMIALILQYSGANWSLFGDIRYELKYPLGRMVEMLPLAICGFEMGRHKLFERIRDKVPKVHLITGLAFILLFITAYPVFTAPAGFGYAGLKKILGAVCLFCLFWSLPFGWCPGRIKGIIFRLSDYTLGIYCLQFWVHNILKWFVLPRYNMNDGTFVGCIVIYISCYLISMAVSHLPVKGLSSVVE